MTQDEPDIYETPSSSPNFKTELAAQLSELIPEAIADGKVDVTKIKELLGDDAGDDRERFGLFWPGKKRALRAAQEPTTATLKPDFENSKDWDTTKNVFIEGDNLEVLKILQKHYHGKIKMIYIDPPYNTGKDFVYPDNYKESLTTYLERTRQVNEEGKKVSSNPELEGRYHSNWLNMMYPRLKLARNLLTQDGAIFISIDDHEQENLKRVCCEVFGDQNFLGQLVWRTATNNNPTNVATDHEYVLVFARNAKQIPKWSGRSGGVPAIQGKYDELKAELGDDVVEIQRRLRAWIRLAVKAGDADLDGVSHYDFVDTRGVYYPGNSSNTKPGDYRYDIVHPVTGLATAKPANGWRWPEATFLAANAVGDVHWGEDHTTVPKIKKRLETATELLKSFYYEDNRGTSALVADLLGGVKGFDNPKSVNFLKRIMRFVTTDSDIVLDFFAGSGSTGHAVMQLNAEDGASRRYIQIQLPEPTPDGSPARDAGFNTISGLSIRRLQAAAERIVPSPDVERKLPLDLGFRAYRLSDTNFSKWRADSETDATALEQHLLDLRDSADDNATPDALLTELMLKQGYSLTEQISDAEVGGLKLKSVGEGLVLAYLDEHTKPTLEQLRAVLGSEDLARFIILEDAFKGDDQLKTNLVQEAKTRGVELWTA